MLSLFLEEEWPLAGPLLAALEKEITLSRPIFPYISPAHFEAETKKSDEGISSIGLLFLPSPILTRRDDLAGVKVSGGSGPSDSLCTPESSAKLSLARDGA